MLVLVTDGLDPLPWPRLLPRRVVLVQVLSPWSWTRPPRRPSSRTWRPGKPLPVGREEVEAYKEALAAHLKALRLLALLRGRYALLRVGSPFPPSYARAFWNSSRPKALSLSGSTPPSQPASLR